MQTRRTFLVTGAAALFAAACGRGGSKAKPVPSTQQLQFVNTSVETALGDRRVAFAVFLEDRPLRSSATASGQLTATDPDGKLRETPAIRSFQIRKGPGGENSGASTDQDVIFLAPVALDKGGFWTVRADIVLGSDKLRVTGKLGVADKSATVPAGGQAVSVPTPTVANHRGVEPYCTRKPVCAMHDVSLDDALKRGKPVIVTFGTPALCTSRLCGPVVDEIEVVQKARPDDATFVHVEIYTDLTGAKTTDPVAAWHIDQVGEPFTFVIGADGIVRERLSGPLASFEISEALDRARA